MVKLVFFIKCVIKILQNLHKERDLSVMVTRGTSKLAFKNNRSIVKKDTDFFMKQEP